jgi:hypothetical protein
MSDLDVTAGLVIKVHAIGKPGHIHISVENLGPEPLSRPEARTVLRQVLEVLDADDVDDVDGQMVSLGEQPHDPTHCIEQGRPHLGPCIDPEAAE